MNPEEVLIIALLTLETGVIESVDSCCHGPVHTVIAIGVVTNEGEPLSDILHIEADLALELIFSNLYIIPY